MMISIGGSEYHRVIIPLSDHTPDEKKRKDDKICERNRKLYECFRFHYDKINGTLFDSVVVVDED